MSELERRRLEEALEAAQGEARGAQLREEQLQAECERLQGELKQLQETRAQVKGALELHRVAEEGGVWAEVKLALTSCFSPQDLASNQSECDMAWVKRVGDDQ